MTLILGFRCSDGVLLASDRKVIRGGESSSGDKVFVESNVAMAFEGLTGLRDDFSLLLKTESQRSGGFQNLYQVKLVVEDIVHELSQRYGDRIGAEAASIGVLLGGHNDLEGGAAQLYYIHGEGYGEAVDYRCSGHGEEYAHTIAKFLHDPAASVDDNILQAAFVIAYVSNDVDITVGEGIQIAVIRDGRTGVTFASSDVLLHAEELAKETKRNLPRLLGLRLT